MKIKLISLGKYPDNYEYDYGEVQELGDYNKEELENKGIELAVYWYVTGSYDGSGQMLFRTSVGLWGLHPMSHCSCYDAIDHLEVGEPKTLDEIFNSCSDELKSEIKEIYEIAKTL